MSKQSRSKKNMSLEKRVKRLEQESAKVETKKYNVRLNEAPVSTKITGRQNLTLVASLLNTAQGTTPITMIGNQIKLTGIAIKSFVHNASTQYDLMFRIAIIRVKGQAALTTAGEEIFLLDGVGQSYDTALARQTYALSLNRNLYDVIFEQKVHLSRKGIDNKGNQEINFYKRYKERVIKFDGNNNPEEQYYVIAWCCDEALDDADAFCEITGQLSMYYKDD